MNARRPRSATLPVTSSETTSPRRQTFLENFVRGKVPPEAVESLQPLPRSPSTTSTKTDRRLLSPTIPLTSKMRLLRRPTSVSQVTNYNPGLFRTTLILRLDPFPSRHRPTSLFPLPLFDIAILSTTLYPATLRSLEATLHQFLPLLLPTPTTIALKLPSTETPTFINHSHLCTPILLVIRHRPLLTTTLRSNNSLPRLRTLRTNSHRYER